MPSVSGMSEMAACPPSPTADDLSPLASPGLLSLIQSVTLLACLLNASPWTPAIALYYCTFQGTLRLKMFPLYLVFAFMYYLYETYYKPIIVLFG